MPWLNTESIILSLKSVLIVSYCPLLNSISNGVFVNIFIDAVYKSLLLLLLHFKSLQNELHVYENPLNVYEKALNGSNDSLHVTKMH